MREQVEKRYSVQLAVHHHAAWAPGFETLDAWREWANGKRQLVDERSAAPVPFVTPMLRRRLSFASRMALAVAWECLAGTTDYPMAIFCSRYGEFARTFELLQSLSRGEMISPMSFSQSVHNTAAGLLAIIREDQTPSWALAAAADTLETGFIDAWSTLTMQEAPAVLLVYFDELLPVLYIDQETSVHHSAALALLLRLPDEHHAVPRLCLSWDSSDGSAARAFPQEPPLLLHRLLLARGAPVIVDTGRIRWTWTLDDEAA